jgi:thiamine-monophosphate kinase
MDEDSIVNWLRKRFGKESAGLVLGIGDDAAVLHPKGCRNCWIVTTDMLLEEIDFRRSWMTAAQLGHKSLAVNLSDLAAMGARPRFFTVALALPADVGEDWIAEFYRGNARLARRHGIELIGGDLSRSPQGIQITITAIGESPRTRLAFRSGGRPGDLLYVTGILGQAAAGLNLFLRDRLHGQSLAERRALKSHRTPEPRCREGLWLAHNGFARCMMDLSDGLSMDLPRLCTASGTGAEICGDRLPVFRDAARWAADPMQLALHGGEDFELLFAVSPRRAARLEAAWPRDFPRLTRIGCLCRGRGISWIPAQGAAPVPLRPEGFDHFREAGIRTDTGL